jgi:hypothetical protein
MQIEGKSMGQSAHFRCCATSPTRKLGDLEPDII